MLRKKAHSQKRMYVQDDYAVLHTALCNENVEFVVLAKTLFSLMPTQYIKR